MDRAASSSLADEFAAAQEWWRGAGVDCAFTDQPVQWLKEETPEAEPAAEQPAARVEAQPASPPPPSIGGSENDWPADLESFAGWWLSEPSLDTGGANPRVPPRGKAGARVMVLVPQPELEDREHLLSGPQGKLLASFLNAASIANEEIYVASALPRHTPHPDWPGLTRAGLGKIALHHAAIARPERVLLFGNDVLTLLENNPAQNPAFLLNLYHQGPSVPALAARSLEFMLNVPSARSKFWRDWLDWTDGLT